MMTHDKSDPVFLKCRPSTWLLLGVLFVFVAASLYLSLNRIYQVDEAQNIFMARVIGSGQTGMYFTNAALWLLGPLAWIAHSAPRSAELFRHARLLMLAVFWLNLVLLTLCTGVRLRSRRGVVVLLLAATLAPLWDYGFEIRHDNVILAILLAQWWTGRVRPMGLSSYVVIGFLAAVGLFVAFKAFLFLIPLSLAFLIFPPPEHGRPRLQLGLGWVAGAMVGIMACRLLYAGMGLWQVYQAGLGLGMKVSRESGNRFAPWNTLERATAQAPLLAGLAAAGVAHAGYLFYRRIQGARSGHPRNAKVTEELGWLGPFPEACLFLGSLAILLINPNPFPYNLVNLVPFAFLLSYRLVDPMMDSGWNQSSFVALVGGIFLFTHLVPFALATQRHFALDNTRQEALMTMAEDLTDPRQDPVYDAIGMVPTRPGINFHWYLHSLNIQDFRSGRLPSVAHMLAARPAAVLITSYRTDWFTSEDGGFIKAHYLPLADDFWVLGQVLPAGGGRCELLRSGRYVILGRHAGSLNPEPLQTGTMDGRPLSPGIVQLGAGSHVLACPATTVPACIWVGPRLNQLPVLPSGDHQQLFVNWY